MSFYELHPTLRLVLIASSVAYRELIKTKLAQLIEIETEFDSLENGNHVNQSRSETIFGSNLTSEGICTISQLIEHISKPKNIIVEGIFRKSGNHARQVELQTMLCSGRTLTIDSQKFSLHDCCCVLKRFIQDLPEPLLTFALKEFFIRAVASFFSDFKRIDAIRLLILLLPDANRVFLKELLSLFNKVIEHSDQNRMSAHNLATVFAPNFFFSSHNNDSNQANEMCHLLPKTVDCLVFMIESFDQIFEPPQSLLDDARIYLGNRERMHQKIKGMGAELLSTANLQAIPSTKFCSTSTYSSEDYTKMQLAELYAQVHSMSNQSPQIKKKWLKKFNRKNGGFGTPILQRDLQQQELIKQSLKMSGKKFNNPTNGSNSFKSLVGSAIKKRLLKTPDLRKKSIKSCSPSLIKTVQFPVSSAVPVVEEAVWPKQEIEQNSMVKEGDEQCQTLPSEAGVFSVSRIPICSNRTFSKQNSECWAKENSVKKASTRSLPVDGCSFDQLEERKVKCLATKYEAMIRAQQGQQKEPRIWPKKRSIVLDVSQKN